MQQRWFAVAVAIALLGLGASAAEKAPENYVKAMKDLGGFAAGIDKAISAEDFDTVATLAVQAREAFAVTETYWKEKNDSEAAAQALEGYKSAADLNVVAGFKNKDGVVYSAMEVKNSCGACHTKHRDQQSDGTSLIK